MRQGTFFPSVAVARLLMDGGADVHAVDLKRNTALHVACRPNNHCADLVHCLLEQVHGRWLFLCWSCCWFRCRTSATCEY